jgi:TonB family protein
MGVTAEMLLSSTNPDHVMARRVSVRTSEAAPVAGGPREPSGDPLPGKGRSSRHGWGKAVAGSALVHAALLAALAALGGQAAPAGPPIVVEVIPAPLDPAADPASREPSAVALPDPPLAEKDEAPPQRRPEGEEGDEDVLVPRTTAPREADGRERVVPAPDEGVNGGVHAERAFRRDRSTLRTRVSDASSWQLSRLRTGRSVSSPQAIRREAVTGAGDAVATVEPSRPPSADHPDTPPSPAGEGAGAPPGAQTAPRVDPHPEIARIDERAVRERGVGPLAADVGGRTFDTEVRGPAVDRQTARAASNERHPGLVDFSRPGTAGPYDSTDGRGPGRTPGATSLMTNGSSPTDYGARNADQSGTQVTVEIAEREYDRYGQDMQRRVHAVLIFPKPLALRLEQGETVLSFSVRPDGSVTDGPRVVKSSGFPEFDAEAISAVLRAAPFPRRKDVRTGTMRVQFENPLIR